MQNERVGNRMDHRSLIQRQSAGVECSGVFELTLLIYVSPSCYGVVLGMVVPGLRGVVLLGRLVRSRFCVP